MIPNKTCSLDCASHQTPRTVSSSLPLMACAPSSLNSTRVTPRECPVTRHSGFRVHSSLQMQPSLQSWVLELQTW